MKESEGNEGKRQVGREEAEMDEEGKEKSVHHKLNNDDQKLET